MILCDVDRLKEINDRFGHAVGDQVLRTTAELLRERVRASDLAARIGGDEFGILCPDTDPESARVVAEELRVRLAALPESESPVPGLTLSIGVAGREPQDVSPTELMLRADGRLYGAKGTRNAVWAGEQVGAT